MSKEFLGRGWKFPVAVDPTTGRIAMSEYEEDIKESIRIIVATAPGERVMRPDFGCGIHELVFSAISRVTVGLFESRIREAITRWEPRVDILKLDISTRDADNGKLEIKLACLVRDTNTEFNLVFPFYLTEGAG
ncbi:MAG TPA: GPW/gp25 family protein [Pyrinomonadaceae bacterium]|nr:GPW/gp25 family protein [Pyrinomonadaceae bacterium]